jgi:argininosuccinate lyase
VSQKTWGGRFSGGTDDRVEAFTESISFDRRLYRHDIRASQAHARMLAEVGLLSAAEAEQIAATLDAIGGEMERGEFPFSTSLEDIHTHIERALTERLGDLGRKLHTGRSRNDQVVTDVKLWVRDAIDDLDGRLKGLQRALLESAERDRDLILPGYTHLQRAQPVLAAHYFLAYVEKYQRDRDRLADCRRRVNVLPLGAAALVRETRFRKEVIAARLEDGFLDATTLMEYLVARGLPMRSAHEAVGKLVRLCLERRCRLADLSPEEYEAVRPGLGAGVYQALGVANALKAFKGAGSTAPVEVAKRLEAWKQRLA